MYEAQCFDLDGNTIDFFTQWDIDQKIVIPISGYEDCLSGDIKQHVHFCNSKRKEALIVRAKVNDDKSSITVDVPNVLLQEPYPLIVYVYLTDSDDVLSQKTVLHNEIPIRKRSKPSDYLYVENIERITIEQIKQEVSIVIDEKKSSALTDIENKRTEAVGNITATKNLAVSEIEGKQSSAIASIEDKRKTSVNEVEALRVQAVNEINNAKASAEASINQIKADTQSLHDAAAQIKADTQQIKDNVQSLHDDAAQIKADTQQIKADTQYLHDAAAQIKADTQAIADNTVSQFVTEIREIIKGDGLELNNKDDGAGNVTTTITATSFETWDITYRDGSTATKGVYIE